MAEPISSSTAGTTLATVALISMLPGVDASIVLGAFSGSIVFVLSSDDLAAIKKIGFLLASFAAGVIGAPMVAALLTAVLPGSIDIPNGVGAMLAAALTVKSLLWLLSRDLGQIIDIVRGGRGDQ